MNNPNSRIIKTLQGDIMDYSAATNLMDHEIRENISLNWSHGEDHQRFFDDYCEAHEAAFGAEFVVN